MSYIKYQFDRVCPFDVPLESVVGIRLKLHSEHGETNWLSVTPEQFKAIERLLIDEAI